MDAGQQVWGFDESGSAGADILIAHARLPQEHELVPMVLSLAYFGKPLVEKGDLFGRAVPWEVKNQYLANVLAQVEVTLHRIPLATQIELMKYFLGRMDGLILEQRAQLESFLADSDPSHVAAAHQELALFQSNPYWRLDSFIKSYGHFQAYKAAAEAAGVSDEPSSPFVLALIDGGLPYHCWQDMVLKGRRNPIYGISRGDGSYPIVNLAGTVATLASRSRSSTVYAHMGDIAVPPAEELEGSEELDAFFKAFRDSLRRKRFWTKVYSHPRVPIAMRVLAPYVLHLDRRRVFEPILGDLEEGMRYSRPRPGDVVVCPRDEADAVRAAVSAAGSDGSQVECLPAEELAGMMDAFLDRLREYATGTGLFKDSRNYRAFLSRVDGLKADIRGESQRAGPDGPS